MSEVKRRLGIGPDLLAAVLAVTLPALLVALWIAPRAAIPGELPPLVFGAQEVRAALAEDHAMAARAETGELAARRLALYREQNRAELTGESPRAGEVRRRALRDALVELGGAHGPDAIARARAADLEAMVRALAGEGSDEERAAALGSFPRSLERWGATRGARRVAPELVVRVLFAARWNAVHGLALTDGFDALRARAYHGWLAFYGDLADASMRAAALDAYARAGGEHADEVRGILAWRAGAWEAARDAFGRAYAHTGVLRLRNHELAAVLAAEAP